MSKSIILAGLFGIFSFGIAKAQEMPSRPNHGVKNVPATPAENIYKELNLSREQRAKLKTINEDSKAQMLSIKNDSAITQKQRKEKMNALRESQKAKRDEILTPEQKIKAEAIRKNKNVGANYDAGKNVVNKNGDERGVKKEKRFNRDQNGLSIKKSNNKNWHKGQRREMMRALNLTKEQKAKWKILNEDNRAKARMIRSNISISPAQKRAEMQELRKEEQRNIRNILTPEQYILWENMIQNRPNKNFSKNR